jgi:hypothetical protein
MKASFVLLALAVVSSASVVQSHLHEPVLLKSTLNQFLEGVYEGMQLNPKNPSSCCRELDNLKPTFEVMTDELLDTFRNMQLSHMSDVIQEFQDFANLLDSSVDRCEFQRLATTIHEMSTAEGMSAVAMRMTTSYASLMKNWSTFVTNIESNPAVAGVAFGKIVSVVLNYHI